MKWCTVHTAFSLACVNVMVMSSADEVSCSDPGGCGLSDVYMFNIMGERTPP